MDLQTGLKQRGQAFRVDLLMRMLILGLAVGVSGSSSQSELRAQAPPQAPPVKLMVQSVVQETLSSLAMSPDERHVMTTSTDGAALWDIETGRVLRRYQVDGARGQSIVAVAPDWRRMATVIARPAVSDVYVWDILSGQNVLRFNVGAGVADGLAMSPNGELVAVLGRSSGINLWSLAAGTPSRKPADAPVDRGAPREFRNVMFTTDGRQVIAWGRSHLVAWDVSSGLVVADRAAPGAATFAAVLPSGNGTLMAVGEAVQYLSLDDGALSKPIVIGATVSSGVVSRDGRRAALVLSQLKEGDGGMAVVDLTAETAELQATWPPIQSVALSTDGRNLASIDEGGSVGVWSSAPVVLRTTMSSVAEAAWALTISPTTPHVMFSTGAGPILWDVAEGREIGRSESLGNLSSHAQFSPSGSLAIENDGGDSVTIRNTNSWTETRAFNHPWSAAFDPEGFDGDRIRSQAMSADEATLVTIRGGSARLWSVSTGALLKEIRRDSEWIFSRGWLDKDGTHLVLSEHTAKYQGFRVSVWETLTGNVLFRTETDRNPRGAFSRDGRSFYVDLGGSTGTTVFDVSTWKPVSTFGESSNALWGLSLSQDGTRLLTASSSGTIVWDTVTRKEVARFDDLSFPDGSVAAAFLSADGQRIFDVTPQGVRMQDVSGTSPPLTMTAFNDGSWAVTDPMGRYDAGNPDHSPGLHWVRGDEVIELGQLKSRFYSPGLLAKVWRRERLPDVGGGIATVAALPDVLVHPPAADANEIRVTLTDRGGGVGPVTVTVNGRRLSGPFLPPAQRPAGPVDLLIPLSGAVLRPDEDNDIVVTAQNAVDRIETRPRGVRLSTTKTRRAVEPHLYVLAIGTSHFSGPESMNLQFAAKDARSMATAVRIGGARLLGAERVHVTVLASDAVGEGERPTKANIARAFEDLGAKAKEEDTVIVYFAGHGVTGEKDTYFYLTQDATSTDISDATVRAARTVSSRELSVWLNRSIKALKQVVILDTCAAGAATGELVRLADRRTVDADQVRALEMLKDATGSFVLMGSAADKVSYEASRYGQGLLTYSLLQAMRGELPLTDGDQLRVLPWFTYAASAVPQLAKDIGGIQQPKVSAPSGSDFPVAILTLEDKAAIPLEQPKRQLLRVVCVDPTLFDSAGLQPLVRARLRALTRTSRGSDLQAAPNFVYLDDVTEGLPGALSATVSYVRTAVGFTATMWLRHGSTTLEQSLILPDNSAGAATVIVDAIVAAVARIEAPQ